MNANSQNSAPGHLAPKSALLAISRLAIALLPVALAAATLAGCGSSGADENKLVIYNGREVEIAQPLYDKFEQQTGIELEVRNAESPELAATIQEEGENSPADVFYAQDAGAIGSVSAEGLLAPLPVNVDDKIDARYRDADGRWSGVTGRVRVLAYNTEAVQKNDLPKSVLDLTTPEWKGRVGIAPGNASFEAFVTAMRLDLGDEKTEQWLQGMKSNDVKTYEKNSQIIDAVAKGEVDAGLVNHYYLYELKSEDPDAPVANHFFANGDPGALVNVSAVGVLASAKHKKQAKQFIEFLMAEGQEYFATEAEEREYPLVKGVAAPEGLPPLDEIQGPDVNLSTFGVELPATVKMIESVGFSGN